MARKTATRLGVQTRAGEADREMIAALGIDIARLYTVVFALGAALAGLAGAMIGPIQSVQVGMGEPVLIMAFVVVVIGGLGSFWGVVAAALIVGVVRGLMVLVYPGFAEAAIYALMAIILLVRPRGLFGERILRFE